ncbi:transcriptional regulator [Streptomyces sp. AJS327]|uniref:transcriptional regulator n=1 Tax=Streptomyces sp. AJS327 TaxID=2545265 RepID=UPI0015DDB787|nr:transcriptional regulator [Streptomyces sp. AJS327]MBA0051232.1 transcriptional regulator [Streptomyces sp. AJS327]
MPDRTRQFGLYGARGEKGSQAAARVLDRLALEGGIITPVTQRRGLRARLRYLDSAPGRQAMREAGITVTPRTLARWTRGEQRPNPANLQRLDAAYRAHRRRNVARHLLTRLNARGGTRVEIHPLDQTTVPDPRRRSLPFRRLRIRRWDDIVSAWQAEDEEALADAWDTELQDLGSDWGKYEWVTSVGFAA